MSVLNSWKKDRFVNDLFIFKNLIISFEPT